MLLGDREEGRKNPREVGEEVRECHLRPVLDSFPSRISHFPSYNTHPFFPNINNIQIRRSF